jgi:hypothetical protein
MIPVAGWVAPFGCPRINACSRLPVAFRSVPRPSSPPGAKASTECPSRARNQPTMHRSHPHRTSGQYSVASGQSGSQAHGKPRTYAHMWRPPPSRAATNHDASERSAIDRGQPASSRESAAYRSDLRPTARPETHQNLIHPDKDHGIHRTPLPATPRMAPPNFVLLCDETIQSQPRVRCRMGANRKIKNYPQMAQMAQISRDKKDYFYKTSSLLICVICGFTLICVNLRFTLIFSALMETIGFEPTTPCLQSRCSPS